MTTTEATGVSNGVNSFPLVEPDRCRRCGHLKWHHGGRGVEVCQVDGCDCSAAGQSPSSDIESVLHEAHQLIHGDRQESYGHPFEDFTRTGRMWGAILDLPDVPAEKVALCLAAVKISRECHAPHRDNGVDGAGYFGCLDLIKQRRAATSDE